MYILINAKSNLNDQSPGKTMWMNQSDIQIAHSSSAPKHLEAPLWHIEIKAEELDESWGERGGEERSITRKLEVHLTPADIAKLLEVLTKNGLLSVSVIDGSSARNA